MIYTVTLNPAIDLFINTNTLYKDLVNRTTGCDIQPNGKGVNVSFILKKLGVDNKALGIGAGFTLNYIKEELSKKQIANEFVETTGITRINVFTNVIATNSEYKLVNPGPNVLRKTQQEFLKLLDGLKKNDIVCVSGSFSAGIKETFLSEIAQVVTQKNAQLVVDTSYCSVLDVLKYQPLLIKPNDEELKSWFDLKEQVTDEQLLKLAKKLVQKGAQNVLLSLGSKGALYVSKEAVYFGNAPKIKVLNTAGAGDTLLATFLAGLVKQKSIQQNLKESIAAGSDTARCAGLTNFLNLEELINQINIKEISL